MVAANRQRVRVKVERVEYCWLVRADHVECHNVVSGDVYRVEPARCSCPAFKYKRRGVAFCKHLVRCRDAGLFKLMQEVPTVATSHPDIMAALAEPFPASELGFKAQAVKGERALAVAYIDARNVMDRLDEVLGAENWQDEYEPLPDGSVVCKLRLRIGGEWITKMDVGAPSEQPDGGDRLKAAFSDALKRAAVKLGIARYLYNLTLGWVDYDPVRKQLKRTPQLPAWALPNGTKPTAKPAPQQQPAETRAERANRLRQSAQLTPADMKNRIHGEYAVNRFDQLTDAQQDEVLSWLGGKVEEKTRKQQPVGAA